MGAANKGVSCGTAIIGVEVVGVVMVTGYTWYMSCFGTRVPGGAGLRGVVDRGWSGGLPLKDLECRMSAMFISGGVTLMTASGQCFTAFGRLSVLRGRGWRMVQCRWRQGLVLPPSQVGPSKDNRSLFLPSYLSHP